MRGAFGGRQLLSGLVAHEIAMRLAVVDAIADQHLGAAVHLTVVSHERRQPPRRASDTLGFFHAQSGTLCCGRVKRRAASKALGRVVRRADGLFKRV